MKKLILSDLHLEQYNNNFVPSTIERDLLLLAGDIGTHNCDAKFIIEQLQYAPVVKILGNHEYYNSEFREVKQNWSNDISDSYVDKINLEARLRGYQHNFYCLQDETVIIGDTKIIGSTLWTDLSDEIQANIVRNYMSDYQCIRYGNRLLTPLDTSLEHKSSVLFIKQELDKEFDGEIVVMTHHAPHPFSIHENFEGHYANPAFYTDLEDIMLNRKNRPNLWIHGHMHNSFNYMVEDVRVVCNPRGYKTYFGGIENDGFDSELVIE